MADAGPGSTGLGRLFQAMLMAVVIGILIVGGLASALQIGHLAQTFDRNFSRP